MPERIVADRYLLERRIGGGGMGVVWLAHDRLLDREVAIKEITFPAGRSGERAATATAARADPDTLVRRARLAEEAGFTITPPGAVDVETARRYADLGAHRLAIQPHTMDGSAIDELIASVSETLAGRI
jgi:serine/threonine protein kinase